ncbi:hypothetical protein [Nioella nitratireducens]|uniref:hypothetical protein n=1 Tax=Nioella nitratireducens TaxID=1287720 RepID=UPI000B114A08|nr:hypothetical protein [Nioella nitratireducens]
MSTAKPQGSKGGAPAKPAQTSREERLKAALKANMGKRKAQSRARAATRATDAEQDEG